MVSINANMSRIKEKNRIIAVLCIELLAFSTYLEYSDGSQQLREMEFVRIIGVELKAV